MVRIVVRSIAGVLLAALLAFPLDWLIWRVRVAAGEGMHRITVAQITVAALKGGKEEYFADPGIEVDCSRSLFPQAGAGACWWLRRHPQVVVQQ